MKSDSRQKILLINPPNEAKTPALPLGLASIAAYLQSKEKNINVSAIDMWAENLELGELKDRTSQTKADIVGVYILSPCYNRAKAVIEVCRQVLPDSLIVAGGPHPSALPVETLQDIPQLDICVIGEGEITMAEIVEGCPLSTIDGIAYRDGKEVKLTKPRESIKNLDELPWPSRDIFPLSKYRIHPPYGRKNPYFSIITSRGCPFQCAYCSKDVFQNIFRARSPKKVCDEIEELIAKYHAKEIRFYDDDFTLDMARAEEICDEILRRGIKIPWSCLTRVDLVNEKLLRKMKEAGCWLISYGIESGNQQILDAIHKGFTKERVISAFQATRKIGIATVGYFMFGLPGETRETIRETLDLAKITKPNFATFGIMQVYPGSHFFKLIKNGAYPGKLRILTQKNEIATILSGTSKGNMIIVLEDNFTLEELNNEVKRANREFYLRPQYIIQSLRNIHSFSELGYYLSAGGELIKCLWSAIF